MAPTNPTFLSFEGAKEEFKVSDERLRFYIKEGHLTAFSSAIRESLFYDKTKKLFNLAKLKNVVRIEGDKIYFERLQLLDKKTMEVIEEIPPPYRKIKSHKIQQKIESDKIQFQGGGAWNINEVQVSFAELENLLLPETQKTMPVNISPTLPNRPLLTVSEVKDFLHVSQSTIYNWMDNGTLKFVTFGKSKRIPRKAVLELLRDEDEQE